MFSKKLKQKVVVQMRYSFFLIVFVALGHVMNAQNCDSYNSGNALSYWEEVSNCSACTRNHGCGFCHSTLTCLSGQLDGPTNGLPCPQWFFEDHFCPIKPTCEEHSTCASCAANTECAWCASRGSCMMVSEIFADSSGETCRGTVFDPPCPVSFIGINRIVGNLHIEKDPAFGGGELHVSGMAYDGKTFEFHVDAEETKILSSQHVNMNAGSSDQAGMRGSGVFIAGGDGENKVGGSGGKVVINGGNGFGKESEGGAGNGGNILLSGGSSFSGIGGQVEILGGSSQEGDGGDVVIKSGKSDTNTSGNIQISTANASPGEKSGSVGIFSGNAEDGTGGSIELVSGSSTKGPGGNILIGVGFGKSGVGGSVFLSAGNSLQHSQTGGSVKLVSGSSEGGSGEILLSTPRGGSNGGSGSIQIATGTSIHSSSGTILFSTGKSIRGKGGDIS